MSVKVRCNFRLGYFSGCEYQEDVLMHFRFIQEDSVHVKREQEVNLASIDKVERVLSFAFPI